MSRKISISDILRIAVCSDLRKNILIALNDGNKPLGDLRDELGVSSTTAIHALRDLEKSKLIFQDKEKNYALTNIGRIMALELRDFSDVAETLNKLERFWLDHDLSGIPVNLKKKIGCLKESDVIQINPLDIIKTHDSYIDFIKEAKWIKGVSPIFSSDYPGLFKKLVEKDVNTQLILTDAVVRKSIDAIGKKDFKDLLENYHLELFIIDDDLKVAFTVSDNFFSLGLFTNEMLYDTSHDLISKDEKAILWGVELFEFYKKNTKRFKI